MFDYEDTSRRLEVLSALHQTLEEYSGLIRAAKIKNRDVREAIAFATGIIGKHCHELEHALKRKEKLAHYQSARASRKEKGREKEQGSCFAELPPETRRVLEGLRCVPEEAEFGQQEGRSNQAL